LLCDIVASEECNPPTIEALVDGRLDIIARFGAVVGRPLTLQLLGVEVVIGEGVGVGGHTK
jgi:hypothetical protein